MQDYQGHIALLVPHYNHLPLFTSFLPKLASVGLPIIVIDDCSDDAELEQLESLCRNYEQVTLIRHHVNRGKGSAFRSGVHHAQQRGFSHVVQVDADGQHNLEDLPTLLAKSQEHPRAIISGAPFFESDAPKARVYGRKVTDFWVAIETLSLQLKDSLCGYRVYPVEQTLSLYDKHYIAPRMSFDTEILVKAVWQGIAVHYVPTKVIYHEQSISHFHYLRDNLELIRLHARLVLGMIKHAPRILYRRFISSDTAS